MWTAALAVQIYVHHVQEPSPERHNLLHSPRLSHWGKSAFLKGESPDNIAKTLKIDATNQLNAYETVQGIGLKGLAR